jgi:hypothetical protein
MTKLRGSFHAYREIVFARMAQKMEWSCQSSAFLCLDHDSAEALGVPANEIHAVHWFLDEHVNKSCSEECKFAPLIGKEFQTVDDLRATEILHILDLAKSDFAACLFGANEPSGHLITKGHEFVIIDSELMFATGPCPLDGTRWWTQRDDMPSPSGQALALEVCREFWSLSSADVEYALALPKGISVTKRWPIATKIKASRKFAADFCASR